MTTTSTHTAKGLVTRDGEGHGNVYAKEPRMEYAAADAGWGFHKRAEKLNGRLAMLGFVERKISAWGSIHDGQPRSLMRPLPARR